MGEVAWTGDITRTRREETGTEAVWPPSPIPGGRGEGSPSPRALELALPTRARQGRVTSKPVLSTVTSHRLASTHLQLSLQPRPGPRHFKVRGAFKGRQNIDFGTFHAKAAHRGRFKTCMDFGGCTNSTGSQVLPLGDLSA